MSVVLCSYVLNITFMLSINTDKQSVELKYNIGFLYIIFNSALLIKNGYKILTTVFTVQLPQLFRDKNQKKLDEQYEEKIKAWLEEKKQNASKDAISKEIYEHSLVIIKIRKLNKELIEKHQSFDEQMKWLRFNGLPLECMLPQKRELISLRKSLRQAKQKHDNTNKESGIRLGESLSGLRGLIFSIEVIKGRHFPHMHDPEIDGNSDIQLQQQGYWIRYFKVDGNNAARVLALRIYGNPKLHTQVRQELSQYLQCQHEFWGSLRGIQDYSEFIKSTFSKSGGAFTPVELLAAAKFYNIPIVCAAPKNSSYNWIELNAYTLEGNKQDPIYMHRRGMLVHRSQTTLLQKYKGSVKPLRARRVVVQLEAIQEEMDEESQRDLSSKRSRLTQSKAQTNDAEKDSQTKRIDVDPEELANSQEIIDFLDEENIPIEVLKVDHLPDFGPDLEEEIPVCNQLVELKERIGQQKKVSARAVNTLKELQMKVQQDKLNFLNQREDLTSKTFASLDQDITHERLQARHNAFNDQVLLKIHEMQSTIDRSDAFEANHQSFKAIIENSGRRTNRIQFEL